MILQPPWLSFSGTSKHFRENGCKDFFSRQVSFRWSRAFLGNSPPHTSSVDNYSQALIALPGWWAHLSLKDVQILAGRNENLVDDIVEFAGEIRQVKRETEFLLAERETHRAPNARLRNSFQGFETTD